MIINKFHTERIKKLIETSGGKIIFGGKVDVEKRHVEPTIILEPRRDSQIMQEEIFGCVLPIIPSSFQFLRTKSALERSLLKLFCWSQPNAKTRVDQRYLNKGLGIFGYRRSWKFPLKGWLMQRACPPAKSGKLRTTVIWIWGCRPRRFAIYG